MPLLNIVIPVYNEGENIVSTLREIRKNVTTPHEIFVVYDFDEDSTLAAIDQCRPTLQPIHLVKNKYGRGALNAIKTGFEATSEGPALVTMADLSDDLAQIDVMYLKLCHGFDLVCGSRYMKGGQQIGGPRLKKMLSRLAGLSLHYLAGIPTHDATNSFKLYSRRVLKEIPVQSNGGFELGMELVIKAHRKGFKIAEVPSTWRDRSAGKSNFKLLQWLPKYLRWYRLALLGF